MNMTRERAHAAHQSKLFTLRSTAAAAIALSGLLAGGGVAAQAATDKTESLETVIITGARKSAESAQLIKMRSDQVVDSIVAEDIGKFPDKNVAEILGRVTGVQIQRGGGEAGGVIVRGLGGVVTLLNGREFFSDAGRSLYLSDVPATMLQRIDVYKSQGADLPEGGTAGVIDVRTNRPFDFKGPQLFGAGRLENRDKAKTNNPDLSGMASNRWKTDLGEIGALVGLSYQRGQYHDETSWVGDPEIFRGTSVGGVKTDVVGSCCMGRVLGVGDRKRLAGNAALQWRPNAEMEFFAEAFYTKIDHDYQTSFLVGGLPWGAPGTVVTTKPGTANLDTIYNTKYEGWGFVSTQAKRDDVANTQLAVGGHWDASAQLRLSSELAHTSSYINWKNLILDINYVPRNTIAAVRDGGGYLDYPTMDMKDPNTFKLAGGVDIHGRRSGDSTDWRADALYEVEGSGFFKEFSTGVRLAKRNAESIATSQPWQNAGPNIGKPAGNFAGLTSLSPRTSGDFGLQQYVLPDRAWMLNNQAAFRKLLTGKEDITAFDPLTFFDNVESTSGIYAKTKFGFDLAGVPISGVAGVRVVKTDQRLKGNSRSTGGVIDAVDVETSRTDALPSLALKAMLTSRLIARLVAGKAIERPAFGDFNPGLVLNGPAGGVPYGSGFAGNPYLKPTEATNLDVALEWYFARTGSLTATVFDHRFKNRLTRDTAKEVHGGLEYLVNRPYNLNKANLEGVELGYRQFYDFLPGLLSGFGLEANFTYMTGEQTSPAGVTTPFLGQSKTSYNLVGLYERQAIYARVAYNWRSKFLAESPYRSTGRELYVAALKTVDASLGYHVNKQMTVSIDVNNLLNQPYNDYFDKDPSLVRDVRYYDRNVGLSVRWRM